MPGWNRNGLVGTALLLALGMWLLGSAPSQAGAPPSTGIFGHVCRTPALAIPDSNPAGVSDDLIATAGPSLPIKDLNVSLDITHSFVGDLVVTLEHLDTGTSAVLIDRPPCFGDDYDILLDDEGTGGPIEDIPCQPVNPTSPPGYTPTNPLSVFDGESRSGIWRLTVSDNAGVDLGTLDEWCLTNLVTSFTASGGAHGLEHDGVGNLWTTDFALGQVQRQEADGSFIADFSVLPESVVPLGITTDGNTLYLTDAAGTDVDLYTPGGTYLSSFSIAGEAPQPEGITYNPLTGNLYVVNTDGGPDSVVEYTPQGTFVQDYELFTSSTDGIAFDPKRCTYWLYDSTTERVRHYDPSFRHLESFVGPPAAGFPGFAEGVAVIGDRLFVVSDTSDAIVEYDISGAHGGYCSQMLATGDLDANGVADGVANFGFGPGLGLWARYNNATWIQLLEVPAERVITADADGNTQKDLIVDFGPGPGLGLWIFLNNTAWFQIHPLSPDNMAAGFLDANGFEDVVVDFGVFGLWAWMNGSGFAPLSSLSPEALLVADITGSGFGEVIADFGAQGLWSFQNLVSWVGLTGGDAESLGAGQMDGLAGHELVADFGNGPGLGLWVLYNGAAWGQINDASPEGFVVADLDNNLQADILVDFGEIFALWVYLNNGAVNWSPVSGLSPQGMSVGQLDGIGGRDVLVDFGPGTGLGLWGLFNASTWAQLTATSP